MVDGKSSVPEVDKYILTTLSNVEAATPKAISEYRLKESLVRRRCCLLSKEGLLRKVSHDLFGITQEGEEFLENDRDPSSLNLGDFPEDNDQIVDFSEIDPEDIKWRNLQYYRNPDHRYDLIQHAHMPTRRINRVRNGDLRRLMREFPKEEPLPQQCAHWVRAIVGLHFFPDANHRTAMATLNTILSLNGIERISWRDKRYRNAIFKSKLIRRFILDLRFDNLWCKDELYHLWHRYFLYCFYDIPSYQHTEPRYDSVERLLDKIR